MTGPDGSSSATGPFEASLTGDAGSHGSDASKYSDGLLYGSLSVAGSCDWSDSNRNIEIGSDVVNAQSDHEKATVVTRLRGAYLFDVGAVDFVPMVDLDMATIHDSGFRETGAGALNLRVDEENHVLADIRPALRIGTDATFDDLTLSGYAEAGARIALTDTSHTLSMPDVPADDSGISLTHNRNDVVGTFAAGITSTWDSGVEARFQYEAGSGSSTRGHQASARLALKF